MFIGGSLAMLVMATGGGMLTNYGWREAQHEEILAAMRAGVAASAHYMRADLNSAKGDIQERVAGFLRGLLGGITIDADDVTVDHDFSTNETTITLNKQGNAEGDARFAFRDLWPGGGGGGATLSEKYVIVAFDANQYEFALALDVSPSMSDIPAGWSVSKLDVLKDTVNGISRIVDDLSKTNPGIIALSVVPYANVVNVADTSGTGRTVAKERYVRMLTGADHFTQTSRDTSGHWVDTFHSYGTGANMGPLASRDLPDFLIPTDWNLHRPATADVSAQAPIIGTWNFRGQDFWNGCVMARWGAYWDTQARPTIWDPADTTNWPARTSVAGWAPGSSALRDLPLHLSDEPPHASNPSTRFTAYSWPDSLINAAGDGHLDRIMHLTLDPTQAFSPFSRGISENFWHRHARDRGGALYCPEATIVPLTDDLTTLQAVDSFDVVQGHSTFRKGGQTFLHLGIVWGLRTLSPLWQDTWQSNSVSGDKLPRRPCLVGGTGQGCSRFVEKAIVMVSDGANFFGQARRGRTFGRFTPGGRVVRNPSFFRPGLCEARFSAHPDYRTAMSAEDPATFGSSFDVDSTGVISSTGISAVLDAMMALHPRLSGLDPYRPTNPQEIARHRLLWQHALTGMTPWQLFRGYDDSSPTKDTDAIDVLMDPANSFGFDGRPVQNSFYCRLHTAFSAYGRADDLVRVGDGPPVPDVAPFSNPSWQASSPVSEFHSVVEDRIDDWLRSACDLAGKRGVRVHAIYIGDDTTAEEQSAIALLEECVDRGYGGNSRKDEVHVTPTEQQMRATVTNLLDVRRTLRFIGGS